MGAKPIEVEALISQIGCLENRGVLVYAGERFALNQVRESSAYEVRALVFCLGW